MSRNNYSSQDKALEKEIGDSLKVSSYKDQIIEAISKGTKIQKNMVPDYSEGRNRSTSNESNSLYSLDSEALFQTAASAIGVDGIKNAMNDVWETADTDIPFTTKMASEPTGEKSASKSKIKISARQYDAIQKYPALIEILGSDEGDNIAQSILCKVNEIMVDRISKNSRDINKKAQVCKAEKQNLKQYFVGDNDEWICTVIASGPFRGDEAFYYDKDSDEAKILRSVDGDYSDVTPQFNLIHELVEKE